MESEPHSSVYLTQLAQRAFPRSSPSVTDDIDPVTRLPSSLFLHAAGS